MRDRAEVRKLPLTPGTTAVPTMPEYEGVVGAKQKSNWLRHLAPVSGEQGWATRSVTTLCGWSGFAVGCDDGARSGAYDRFHLPLTRRNCQRCAALADRASGAEGNPK